MGFLEQLVSEKFAKFCVLSPFILERFARIKFVYKIGNKILQSLGIDLVQSAHFLLKMNTKISQLSVKVEKVTIVLCLYTFDGLVVLLSCCKLVINRSLLGDLALDLSNPG